MSMSWLSEYKEGVVAGLAIIAGLITLLKATKKDSSEVAPITNTNENNNTNTSTNENNNTNTSTNENNTTVNVNIPDFFNNEEENSTTSVEKLSDEEIQIKTSILFIDDIDFPMVKILKNNGWNASRIKDVKDLYDKRIKTAHILFIDILDVGAGLGLGNGLELAKAIKEKYEEKKVIIYSSQDSHDIFNDAYSILDGRLRKSAQLPQFLGIIEKHAETIFNG